MLCEIVGKMDSDWHTDMLPWTTLIWQNVKLYSSYLLVKLDPDIWQTDIVSFRFRCTI